MRQRPPNPIPTHSNNNDQVNHFSARCVEAASKPTSWAVRQIETAANFCIDSWFWSLGKCTCMYHLPTLHTTAPRCRMNEP